MRTVKTTVPGLDMVLGGGVAMFPRASTLEDSASLLVRGSAGVGKSALAVDIAMGIAAQRGGDVVHACVELLPSEVTAQYASLHGTASPIVAAPFSSRPHGHEPGLFVGVLDAATDPPLVWLGAALEALLDEATRAGATPRVLLLDALSESYQLGGTVSRELADGLAKLGAERGVVLVLVEEVDDLGTPSAWTFVVDLVIELERVSERRSLRVTKNRFGAFDARTHELEFATGVGARVLPHPAAYLQAWDGADTPNVLGDDGLWAPLNAHLPGLPPFRSAIVVVQGANSASTRLVASWLGDVQRADRWPDILVRFDEASSMSGVIRDLRQTDIVLDLGDPYLSGHMLIDRVIQALDLIVKGRQAPRRVMLGDLAVLEHFRDRDDLRRAILVVAHALAREGLPVVLFETTTRSWASDMASVVVDVIERETADAADYVMLKVTDRARARQTLKIAQLRKWERR